ncbi:hypothetical protein [Desulfonauticus submarinus]|nr:hypothetical protein [Desulfonauticus submarinus]
MLIDFIKNEVIIHSRSQIIRQESVDNEVWGGECVENGHNFLC